MAITFPFIKELDFSVVEQDFKRLLNNVTPLLDGKAQKCLTTEVSLYQDPAPNVVTIGYEACLDRRTHDIKVDDLISDIENYVKVNYKAYYELDTDVRQEPHVYATLYERLNLDIFILLLESPTDVRVRVMTNVELSDTTFSGSFFQDRLKWMKDWIATPNHLIAQVDKYTLYFNDNMDIVSILCSGVTVHPCEGSCITTEIKSKEYNLKPMTVFGKMEDCLVMDSPYMTTCLFPFKAQKTSQTQTEEYYSTPCWVRQTEFRAETLFRLQSYHDTCTDGVSSSSKRDGSSSMVKDF